jgi:uncharacterized protein (TIGR02145 family)
MKKTILLLAWLAFFTCKNQAQTVTDIEGNVYQTVTIGAQVWMAENLKTIKFNDNTSIPLVTDNTEWGALATPGYCWYNNDAGSYKDTYGALYNWFAVNVGNLCPTNWHVPTDAEWTILTNFLGGEIVAGGKMKSIGTIQEGTGLWQSPNAGATNESGFTARPGSARGISGGFTGIGGYGFWWTTSEIGNSAWLRELTYGRPEAIREADTKTKGLSIRCVRDYGAGINNNNFPKNINIYPNPAIDHVIIDCGEKQNIGISIYNIVGKLLFQKESKSSSNEIDIGSLSKGIYVIQITGSDWTVKRKLIKE